MNTPLTNGQMEDNHTPLIATRQALVELQAFHTRISVLQEIAMAITRRLTVAEILQEAGQRVKWLLDFDHCSIYLKEADSFQVVTLFGPSIEPEAVGVGSTLIEKVIQTRQPQLISDVVATGGNSSLYRSQMVIPLTGEGQTLGTINFNSRKPQSYDLEDLRVGNLLAMQLAAAIRNARQFEEITQLYTQLERTYEDLRHAENLRHDLNRMIVHDLRNPLNVIVGSLELELMLNQSDEPETQRYLTNALTATHYIINMTDDLLDVSRLDDRELKLVRTPVYLVHLLAEKEKLYQGQAEKEKKLFRTYVPLELPEVTIDVRLIGRVIDNLINNAFKYTSARGCVELLVEQKDRALWVQIRDDGQGIPPEYLDHIFDKFVQVLDPTGAPLRKGTGLGLAFCRLAVEAHNGKIWAESTLGQGSTFIFTLPLDGSGVSESREEPYESKTSCQAQ